MSTLRLTTISNQTGSASVPSDTVINGSAKAWVNFNGTGTVAIRASFNVSSITDNGAGDYTVNFTTPLVDANYSIAGSGSTGNGYLFRVYDDLTPRTTALFRTAWFNLSGTTQDSTINNLSVFR
jgi:hypothetical protein